MGSGRPEASAGSLRLASTSLYYLLTFQTVANEMSFTRAAEVLNLSQPAVSGHIRALERQLDARLFITRHRRPHLTAEGQALLEYSVRIFHLVHEAEQAVAATRNVERGRLAIAASTTVGIYLLPALLRQFAEHHPSVELEVVVDTTKVVVQQVLHSAVQFGLVEAPVRQPGVDAVPFAEDEMVLIASPEHPLARSILTLADLNDAPLVRRESGSVTRQYVRAMLHQAGVVMRTVLVLSNTEAVKQAVLAAIGLAWVPRITVARELEAGTLVEVRVQDFRIRRPLSIVTARSMPLSPSARAFLTLLQGAPHPQEAIQT